MNCFKKCWSWIFLVAPLSLLVGCDSPTNNDQMTNAATVAPIAIMPSAIVMMGKTKATERFLTGRWRVVSINGNPVDGDLMLDLTQFSAGKGEFYDGCERILVAFNTHDLSDERLLIDHSTRKGGDCNSMLIDEVMWMLSDVYAFERKGDDLKIIAMKNAMHLVPV
ncbi:hypothetical protein M2R47_01640 [Moraxella sp. Tifton1]|uniref:hypothetical protein n=1 Tax=Moraxella oculi TaxID=2940516 RepID=UPI0020112A3A|nr:hypothetical protein [Moraxella sp. Tifton1]MCL1622957.1 hypothetical protein [Moraxella sp. Tifton1]